jgi:hypothetical protein
MRKDHGEGRCYQLHGHGDAVQQHPPPEPGGSHQNDTVNGARPLPGGHPQRRVTAGNARLKAAAAGVVGQLEPVRPLPWLLAHTLAHLIMREAAPQAGYPLPALRERIYATDHRTAALIYTAAGDVQGTLGGLVELGSADRLSRILEEMVDAASWCATDPVCAEDSSGPRGRGCTPGACHHCLLLPETCCESFNRGLDRLVVLGGQTVPGFLTQ